MDNEVGMRVNKVELSDRIKIIKTSPKTVRLVYSPYSNGGLFNRSFSVDLQNHEALLLCDLITKATIMDYIESEEE